MKKKIVLVGSLALIVVLAALIFVVYDKHSGEFSGTPAIPLVKVNDVLYVYDSDGYSTPELPETYAVIGEVIGEITGKTTASDIPNGYAFGLKTGEKIYQTPEKTDEVFVYTTLFSSAGAYRYVRFTA